MLLLWLFFLSFEFNLVSLSGFLIFVLLIFIFKLFAFWLNLIFIFFCFCCIWDWLIILLSKSFIDNWDGGLANPIFPKISSGFLFLCDCFKILLLLLYLILFFISFSLFFGLDSFLFVDNFNNFDLFFSKEFFKLLFLNLSFFIYISF